MPRKGHVRKRETVPDTRFGNPAVAKFISSLMKGGKKSVAERILYTALDNAAEKLGTEPFDVFEKAMSNVAHCPGGAGTQLGAAQPQHVGES